MKLSKYLPSLLSFALIVTAFVFVVLPVLHDGLFHVYDNVHVTRLIAFSSELAGGQFPVRYLDSFGHGAGYFLFKFYSPLIYYLGSLFYFAGFSYIQSLKLVYLFFIALCSLGIYTLLRSLVGRFASTVATLSFLLSPYLYHVFFHRGTITEAAAMMLIPWLVLAFTRLRNNPTKTNIVLSAVTIALTVLTHTLTAAMGILVVALYSALSPDKTRTLRSFFMSLVLGISLSAFFLLPSVASSKLVQYTNNSLVERGYLDHPVAFIDQAFALGDGTEKTAFLGLTLITGFLFTLALTLTSAKFRKNHSNILVFSLLATSIGFFVMSPVSSIIWEKLIYLRYVQFPFRFLTVVTVCTSILYALLLEHFSSSKLIKAFLTLLVFLPLLISPQFHKPLGYQYTTDYLVEDPCMTTAWADEHLPIWVNQCLLKSQDILVEPLSGSILIDQVAESDSGRLIKVGYSGEGELLISKYYFPGWVASNPQGQNLPLSPHGEHGLIKMSVIDSDSPLTLELKPTLLENISTWITLISLLISVILIYSHYVKYPRTKN